MKKIGLILLTLYSISNAGMFGTVVDFGKDKAKEAVVEKTKDAYIKSKKERRDFESKSNKKSTISHLEDGYINSKNELSKTIKSGLKAKN